MRWTERTHDPTQLTNAATANRVAPGTRLTTAYIWVIATIPIVATIGLLGFDFRQYMIDSISISSVGSSGVPQLPASYLGILALNALSFVIYGVTVFMAFLDWRELGRRGLGRPFHWAWSFLGPMVYVIGRTVIISRRGGRDFAPLWVLIGVTVLGFVISMVKVFDGLAAASAYFPTVG